MFQEHQATRSVALWSGARPRQLLPASAGSRWMYLTYLSSVSYSSHLCIANCSTIRVYGDFVTWRAEQSPTIVKLTVETGIERQDVQGGAESAAVTRRGRYTKLKSINCIFIVCRGFESWILVEQNVARMPGPDGCIC
jgi:hypothetical protein